jgi:hypothetical protein
VNILRGISVCFIALVYVACLIFFSKVEARQLVAGRVDPVGANSPPPVRAPLNKKKRRGGKASQGASIQQAPCLASVRGRG